MIRRFLRALTGTETRTFEVNGHKYRISVSDRRADNRRTSLDAMEQDIRRAHESGASERAHPESTT